MRYRVEVDLGSSIFEIDAENSDDALKEAMRRLDYIGLSELLACAETTVEPIEASQQDRGEQQD